MNRFTESDDKRNGDGFDISQIGFKGVIATIAKPTYPHLTIEQYSELGPGAKYVSPDNTASLQVTLSRNWGRHFMKFGTEYRHIQSNRVNIGDSSGRFDFTRAFTRRNPEQSDAYSGSSIASLLLGFPSGGQVDSNAARTERWKYYVGFVQDDIKVARNFSVNLGLRWDYEQPVTEKWNRINRGFDRESRNPFQDKIDSKYGLDLRGGLLFAGVGGQPRGGYNPDWNTWQPRAGFAWRFTKKSVLRGGYGLYFSPTSQLGAQAGFSRSTPFIGSLDSRIPAIEYNTLDNPYPRGLLAPSGSSEGLASLVGFGFSFDDPDRRVPRAHQFSMGFQRELPARFVLDVSYVGSRGKKLSVSQKINEVSADQYAQGPSVLNKQAPNPFYGVLLLEAPLGRTATVAQSQLMRPYPQFQGITMDAYSIGHSWYNSLQARLDKRFAHGVNATAAYTWSRNMEQMSFLNAQDSDMSRELAGIDRSHRFVVSGMWDLPVGRGKLLARDSGRILNQLLGGWQVNWILNFQSGVPTSYPSGAELTGINPRMPDGLQTFDEWFNNGKASDAATAFANNVPFFNRPNNTLRRIQLRFPNVRNHYEPQINLSVFKIFRISERCSGQLRAESFNVTNTPIFPGPNTDINSGNFGKVTLNQINFPRHIQMALKLRF